MSQRILAWARNSASSSLALTRAACKLVALSLAALSVVALPARAVVGGEAHVVRHEGVLGTSFELIVWTASPQLVGRAENVALDEVERMSRIVSTYDPNSEVSQWQTGRRAGRLSVELTDLLRACERWRTRTDSAFHPGVEQLSRVWRAAEKANSLPDDAALSVAVARLKSTSSPWTWSGDEAIADAATPLSFNAIAKGQIIDAALAKVMAIEGIDGATVNIGGDLRTAGRVVQGITIPSPRPEVTRGERIDEVTVTDRAVATSSAAYRGYTIQGRRYSHLLDPRTGRPVDHVLSATIVARTALDADALATACSVLKVDESLRLIESLDGVECLIVERDGARHASRGWGALTAIAVQDKAAKAEENWANGFELKLDLEINQADSGGRYRRPYVAAWVEDSDGFPVRTLVLWVQSTGPGPRWIPDLKRWYRSDRLRKLADGTDLVTTVSEATRKPGRYSVVWKGADDQGKAVKPGEYTLYVEAAREHGTYQVSRKKIVIGDKPFSDKLEGNIEIKAATLEYRKSTADGPGR
ncbi:MAG TPA: DUF2271 domain-containing protein [Pirellulaceae bacterium]|nr:DUF2271 domain-containing protein [Pirellulaceae bacterium]